VECKHQRRPVSRDEVLILDGKLRDTGAHKGMLFATSGFQDGAIKLAKKRGIACVVVTSGDYIYRTKELGGIAVPPSCIELPNVVGLVCRITDEGLVGFFRFDDDLQDGLHEMVLWLLAPSPDISGQRV
jgi:restriction system protein